MTIGFAVTAHTLWVVSLIIGVVAALIAAVLLAVLVSTVGKIDRGSQALLGVAGQVAANTANVPALEATAPVLGLIQDEVLVLDDYMNALTDGYGVK